MLLLHQTREREQERESVETTTINYFQERERGREKEGESVVVGCLERGREGVVVINSRGEPASAMTTKLKNCLLSLYFWHSCRLIYCPAVVQTRGAKTQWG